MCCTPSSETGSVHKSMTAYNNNKHLLLTMTCPLVIIWQHIFRQLLHVQPIASAPQPFKFTPLSYMSHLHLKEESVSVYPERVNWSGTKCLDQSFPRRQSWDKSTSNLFVRQEKGYYQSRKLRRHGKLAHKWSVIRKIIPVMVVVV